MNVAAKVTMYFLAGAAIGGGVGYFVGKKIEAKNSDEYCNELKDYYENVIAELKSNYNKVKDGDISEETVQQDKVPIDPLDRIVSADSDFVDYSTLTSEYFGDESGYAEAEIPADPLPKKEEPKSNNKKSEGKKKARHKLPVEAISEEDFFELTNDENYKLKQFYLDGDIWTRLNSNDVRDDISVDDFPIPLSDFKWTKSGMAYYVNHEAKQLYKFHNKLGYE